MCPLAGACPGPSPPQPCHFLLRVRFPEDAEEGWEGEAGKAPGRTQLVHTDPQTRLPARLSSSPSTGASKGQAMLLRSASASGLSTA